MSIGDAWSSFMGSMDKEASFKLLDAFFEARGNFIDTSCNYQDEQSEASLGEWMAARKNRDQIHDGLQVICTGEETTIGVYT
jgi:aryl-alcohol dehydrogenase-like predicted oxidoreductase